MDNIWSLDVRVLAGSMSLAVQYKKIDGCALEYSVLSAHSTFVVSPVLVTQSLSFQPVDLSPPIATLTNSLLCLHILFNMVRTLFAVILATIALNTATTFTIPI
jgi:hypothetical protein